MSDDLTNQTAAHLLLVGSQSTSVICKEMTKAVREENPERAISIFKLAMERG